MININLRGAIVMVKTQHHNVNTKSLVKHLDDNIVEMIETIGHFLESSENSEALALLAAELLAEMQEEGKIYNYKVLCDERNNDPALMKRGIYTLSIEFRQTNCINVTKLNYTFTDPGRNVADIWNSFG